MSRTLLRLIITAFFLFPVISYCNPPSTVPIGINAHIYTYNKTDIKATLDKIHSLGISAVRIDAPWKVVETKKGSLEIPPNWDYIVDYSNQLGIKVLFILDYGNKFYDSAAKPLSDSAMLGFINYVDTLTKHFSNKVAYYQIWNEWNSFAGDTKPGSVIDYKRLVKLAYPVIKRNSSESIVITSSFSPAAFNKAMGIAKEGDYLKDYLTPDMAQYTDALAIHPYTVYRRPPFDSFKYYAKQVDYAISLVRGNSLFKDKPIIITEIGWTTSKNKSGVSNSTQAEYLGDAICQAANRNINMVFIYDLKDDGREPTDPEKGFGILNDDMSNKPSADRIRNSICNKH